MRAGTLSGPEAFSGFRPAKSFCTPSSLMISGSAGGCAGPASLLAEDCMSSLVNTDLNCSLSLQALEWASEYLALEVEILLDCLDVET